MFDVSVRCDLPDGNVRAADTLLVSLINAGPEPMYALFEGNKQIGDPFPTEKEVWEAALIEGLVTDVPVADEEGGRLLPAGYHVAQVEETFEPKPGWKLPREIS